MDDRLMAAALEAMLDGPTGEEGSARVRALLEQIEATSPGQIAAMAARLELRSLGLKTAH